IAGRGETCRPEDVHGAEKRLVHGLEREQNGKENANRAIRVTEALALRDPEIKREEQHRGQAPCDAENLRRLAIERQHVEQIAERNAKAETRLRKRTRERMTRARRRLSSGEWLRVEKSRSSPSSDSA